jgi:hypothetical protein
MSEQMPGKYWRTVLTSWKPTLEEILVVDSDFFRAFLIYPKSSVFLKKSAGKG